MIYNRTVFLALIALFATGLAGCSSTPKRKGGAPAPVSSDVTEAKAQIAVDRTTEDEKHAPKIQREMNDLFFLGKKLNPGGLDAFSDERLAELDTQMKDSKSESIAYYLENRKFFERVEDAGGGFRVVTNGKRLVPYLKTKVGRRKLFQMDLARVREMIAHPCFSALEDCGEDASDGEENTALLDEWSHKYPDPEFRNDREKVIRSYLASLDAYRARFEKRVKAAPAGGNARKFRTGKDAALYLGTHRRGVESLLAD